MFTGIVEGKARVVNAAVNHGNMRLEIDMGSLSTGVRKGDSVSVNGVCLSVVSRRGRRAAFDVIAETIRRTNLGLLKVGDAVNVERSMRLGDIIGGHLVTGHVDGTGKIERIERENGSLKMVIVTGKEISSMIMEKGIIAVDGISLTPAEIRRGSFALYLIPETLSVTTLSSRKKGDTVNIEVDIFGKYIKKFVSDLLRNSKNLY